MSLDKLTVAEAEALVRLQSVPDFNTFMAILGGDMSRMNERLIRTDMPTNERSTLVGQLRLGSRLTDAVLKSKDTLQQHKQPKS